MTKKENLEKSIEENKSKIVVKYFFQDYSEEYSRLRNPTKNQTEEYRQVLIDYSNYMYFDGGKK